LKADKTSKERKRLFDEGFLKRLEYLHLVSRKVVAGRQRAERRSKKVGSGMEFADHRDYAPGDDFRYLDWKVYARMERLLLRLYEEEEDLTVYLLVDASRSMNLGLGDTTKFDHAARIAAALAYISLANLDRVCIIPFGSQLIDRMPPTRGKNQIFKVFSFLEKVEPSGVTDLQSCLRKFVHQNTRRGMAVVLSDFYDPTGYDEALNYLRYNRYEPFIIHLFDDLELKPQLRGDLRLVDCETGGIKEVTVTPRLLTRYRQVHEEFSDGLKRYCRRNEMSYFRTPIQVPFDEVVLRIFRSGGFLK
jgi:uncharacterized protein (DUF58 family)